MDKYTIGKNIRQKRENLKMTQLEFGNLIGVTSQTISGWESGYRMPDVIILSKIAAICKTDISTFLEEPDCRLSQRTASENSSLHLTVNEVQVISKLRSLPAEKRRAFEIILGVKEKSGGTQA